jgi:hypothetical protein
MWGPQKWSKDRSVANCSKFWGRCLWTVARGNWFTLKLKKDQIHVNQEKINGILHQQISAKFVSHSLTDKFILPWRWSASWKINACWLFTTHLMLTNFYLYSLKWNLHHGKKILQDIPDIKMDANAKLNAVPLDTSMSVMCNFNCELVGKLQLFLL